jgi:ribonuclease-3
MAQEAGIDAVQSARAALRARLASIIGDGEVPHFEQALTHRSFANEENIGDNQRLEFLGDAVLGLCVSELLVAAQADADEGKLSRMRSALVNGEALARWARRVDLGPSIALGRGARARTERDETNVLADAVEALVAAVYEGLGMAGARALVADIVADAMANPQALDERDPKGMLQELSQARGMGTPAYRVVGTRGGPPEQLFEVEVWLGDRILGRGEGRSKRLAEKVAAVAALATLAEPPSRPDGGAI